MLTIAQAIPDRLLRLHPWQHPRYQTIDISSLNI
jgi:hypothetical protein